MRSPAAHYHGRDCRSGHGFLGGSRMLFEKADPEQLIVLLENWLDYECTALDIGCRVLRSGRWIILLLRSGRGITFFKSWVCALREAFRTWEVDRGD